MIRTAKCLVFELKHAARSIGIFLAFFISCYALSFFLSFLAGSGNSDKSGMMLVFFPFLIYLFIYVSINYSSHYNLLMTLGNTRLEILSSQFLTYGIVSLGSACITQILDGTAGLVFNALGFPYYDVFAMCYGDGHSVPERIVFYFALYLLISAVSLLLGTVRYHFGRNVTRIFWIIFGLSWVFLVPLVEWLSRSGIKPVVNAAKFYTGFGAAHGLLQGAACFAVTALLIGIIAWMLGRRQELIVAEKQS